MHGSTIDSSSAGSRGRQFKPTGNIARSVSIEAAAKIVGVNSHMVQTLAHSETAGAVHSQGPNDEGLPAYVGGNLLPHS